ncbi:MAG: EVE domain-containing protein [Acidobacteriota bacterium]
MKLWLFKEEPSHYPWDQLVEDGKAVWTGVKNNWAQKNLREETDKGDRVLYYHTGGERAVVGIAEVVTDPYPDPNDDSGKRVVVDIEPVRKLKRPVPLAEIKQETTFEDSPLVKIGRLSVVPITAEQWAAVERLEQEPDA